MSRRRRRSNPVRVIVLILLVAGALYINQVVVPATPPLFVPTPTPTSAPESFVQDAEAQIREGKINQAIETYKRAAKADPSNPSIYIVLARWQVLYGDYDGAMENVQNALLLNPDFALAKAVRGWILGKQGEFNAGELEIEEALEKDPNSALAYAYLAELQLDRINANAADLNTLQKAIDASIDAVERDPNLLEVRRARGLVLQNTTNHEEAIQEFEAAIAMNENLADLYLSLGISYRLTLDTARAEQAFLRAIALRPDDADPYAELAATYLNAGDFSKGAQYAAEAVERDPADPFYQGLLGTMYFKNFQYFESIPPLRLSVRGGLSPEGVQVTPMALTAEDAASIAYFSRYGIALAYQGECGEALQVAQELVQKVPGDENAAYNADVMIEECRLQADAPESSPTLEPTATEQP